MKTCIYGFNIFSDPENCIPQEDGSCLTEDEIDDKELLNDQFV